MQLPNALTASRFLLAILGGVFLVVPVPYQFTIAAALFILSALSDLLDGFLARRWRMTSDLGAFMDPLADKLLVFIYFSYFTVQGLYPVWLLMAAIARDLLHDGYRNYAASKGVIIGANLASKIKTALQLVSLICILVFASAWEWNLADERWAPVISSGIWLMIAALAFGIIGTVQFVRRNLFLLSSGE